MRSFKLNPVKPVRPLYFNLVFNPLQARLVSNIGCFGNRICQEVDNVRGHFVPKCLHSP